MGSTVPTTQTRPADHSLREQGHPGPGLASVHLPRTLPAVEDPSPRFLSVTPCAWLPRLWDAERIISPPGACCAGPVSSST